MSNIREIKDIIPEIRPFLDRDLDQMKRIEKKAFVDYPWTTEDFAFFLRRLGREHEAFVAEWRENILGFLLLVRSEWSYEIVSLAVVPEFRRIGVGSQLIEYVKNKLIPYSREDIYARVRQTNKYAIQFFKEQGFDVLELVPNCYDDMSEGCYKMKYELTELPLKEEYLNL
jgi:[ribosomal protein S18]-alanine N-acetyltransferase